MNLLVTNPTNIRYLTGFVGVESRDAYVLLTKNKTYFFTSSLYMGQAKQLSNIQIIQLTNYPMEIKKLGIKKLEFEEQNLTVAEYEKLKTLNIELVPTTNKIEKLRQIKKPDEIKQIRAACKLTDACFDFIIKKLHPGVTESDVAWEIETFFRKNNASGAFSPIVAFGAHSSMPHYQSGSDLRKGQTLLPNDLVLLDFGAKYNGYCADMTRMVFLGKPPPAYNAVARAQEKVFELLHAGERNGATLDSAAKQVIADAGFAPYQHSLGHSIGLDVHEGPRLTDTKEETLFPGMVFSVEPGVYIEGQYGIRIEDLVLLKKDSIEILSKSKK